MIINNKQISASKEKTKQNKKKRRYNIFERLRKK